MDDRSERLRKRRKRSTARSNGRSGSDGAPEPSESDEPSGGTEPSKSSELPRDGDAETNEIDGRTADEAETDEGESAPVKEQRMGTYMYLPETQVKRLRRQYNVLKAEYEFEYDEEFEKNRHFYPLVVQYGLEGLDELDTEGIRSRLEELR